MNQSDDEPGSGTQLGTLFPDTAHGWHARGPDREFDKNNLFDLIDGGAEVYRSLNVETVLSRVYSKDGAADIFVDLFDMGTSFDAYGAYHHDVREKADAGVGQESEYQGGSLYFWRNRYFVSIVALAETAETKSAVMTIGKEISKGIGKDGKKPRILNYLPQDGLKKQHLYFFHDAETLARRYLVGEENPLKLSSKTDGLLAMYRFEDSGPQEESTAVLMVVTYKKKAEAKAALEGLFGSLFQTAVTKEALNRGENRWASARTKRSNLFVVLEATRSDLATSLLDEALKLSKK